MARRAPNGAVLYGVWVVRTRNRSGFGDGELLAEFRSQRFANAWCRQREATRTARPA